MSLTMSEGVRDMNWKTSVSAVVMGALVCVTLLGTSVRGQVGKSLGVVDANLAPEADLLKMPHMTPAIVKGLIEKRNYASITELNAYLLGAGLTQEKAMEFYTHAFVHVNLNTATREEILLIPGAGRRMTIEFPEYRPWKTFAQFDKEIGKYIGAEATDKLKQFVFIPVDLNTATDEDILSIPGAGARMVREFKEYRPWKTKAQFDKEISKYVGQKETDRLWRFVVIQ
jgi:DNA uptake protein ComE-like DNA-binding protein